jgi:hypothetical protein
MTVVEPSLPSLSATLRRWERWLQMFWPWPYPLIPEFGVSCFGLVWVALGFELGTSHSLGGYSIT